VLIRTLADFAPANATHASVRQHFYSRLSEENCILWGHARYAECGPYVQTLSLRAAWGGQEHFRVDNRIISVDDTTFLVLNQGRTCSSFIRAAQPVEVFSVFFRPGLAEQVCGQLATSVDQALSQGETISARPMEFFEFLQPHNHKISPVLRYLKMQVALGISDASWYEEQLYFLLERLVAHHEGLVAKVRMLPLSRPATRFEVYRRIGLATDYLHANYRRSIVLDELAKVACLSKYHFIRLFSLIHGVAPIAYLQRMRVQAAAHLLSSTDLSCSEIAALVGMGARSSMVRQVRYWTGLTPRKIRSRGTTGQVIDDRARAVPSDSAA
jgi:AraC family transcriptional regulator